jgi:hypothetical protein
VRRPDTRLTRHAFAPCAKNDHIASPHGILIVVLSFLHVCSDTGVTRRDMYVVVGCHYYASHTGTTLWEPRGANGAWHHIGNAGIGNRPGWVVRYFKSIASAGTQNIGCDSGWHVGPFFKPAEALSCEDFTVPGGSCMASSSPLILWTDRTYDYGGSSGFSAGIDLFDGSWLYAKFGHDTPTCAQPQQLLCFHVIISPHTSKHARRNAAFLMAVLSLFVCAQTLV